MKPYVIVFGNEKGGTGKSTLAMHIAVYLLNSNFKVGTIDIDARQETFTQYFERRKASPLGLKVSIHAKVPRSQLENNKAAAEDESTRFREAVAQASDCNFIVIDTPGNDTFLSGMAHALADTLVTPLNESFVDLDVLVRVSNGNKILRPSIYAETVWNQRKERAKNGLKPMDWIVVRNRLNTLYSKNRGEVSIVLEALAKRIGFRLGAGFCERVIFKELFLSGTTLLDLEQSGQQLNLSHVSARQELRDLINFMKLPGVSAV
ncbi:MAG: division plane positioning ATPase MipZ [Holosporaceae bacterium]|nr:division plane positioning ATPase MipZ [Holosporaceae bacterium]